MINDNTNEQVLVQHFQVVNEMYKGMEMMIVKSAEWVMEAVMEVIVFTQV